jgi:hypothetical protein
MSAGSAHAVVTVMEHYGGLTPDSYNYQRHTSDVLMVLILKSHL